MAYKKFALYFKRFDQIVHEIIANLFTHSFLSVSFTHLNPFNSPRQVKILAKKNRENNSI